MLGVPFERQNMPLPDLGNIWAAQQRRPTYNKSRVGKLERLFACLISEPA
jgi:hypothetical protein